MSSIDSPELLSRSSWCDMCRCARHAAAPHAVPTSTRPKARAQASCLSEEQEQMTAQVHCCTAAPACAENLADPTAPGTRHP